MNMCVDSWMKLDAWQGIAGWGANGVREEENTLGVTVIYVVYIELSMIIRHFGAFDDM